MLPKPNRFSLKTERFRIEREGQTLHSPLFVSIFAPSSLGQSAPPRFAILVGKKLAPLSVTRHHLKRQISEVIRHHLKQFPSGLDFFLIPKKLALTATQDEILSDLLKSLNAKY